MTKVAINKITIDPSIQIRRGTHEATLQRYEESFEKLPPIDVFETPDGLLLSDGWHRITAAERLGLSEIEATVRKGSWNDAAEHAVIANMRNADPLTTEERNDGVRRLKRLHPDWSLRQIADSMSISYKTVQRVFDVDTVKKEVAVFTPVTRVTDSHFSEVAQAEREAWKPLVEAAQERGWTRDETRQAVQNLKDERIPQQHKEAILAGEADPLVVRSDGQFAIPADTVGRRIREAAESDAYLAFQHAIENLARARTFSPEEIASSMSRQRLDHLMEEIPGYIDFLEQVLSAAQREGRKLEAVK